MPTYVLKAPNGTDVEVTGDHYPRLDEQQAIFSHAGLGQVETPPKMSAEPTFWDRHPAVAQLTRGALNTLPVVGTVVGGALATPETLGVGTVAGAAIGAGAGRGAADLVSEGIGLDESTPQDKAGHIGREVALTAITPAVLDLGTRALRVVTAVAKMGGPEAAADVVGMFSPRAANALRVTQRVMGRPVAAAAPEAAATTAARAAAPAETAVAETAPPAPAPAPAAPAASLPAERALKILIDAGLNPSEADQALKWLRAGVPLETVQQRILSSQAFASKVPGVASDAEVHGVIVHRRPRGPQPE